MSTGEPGGVSARAYDRPMPTYLSRLIEYNSWANRGLLEFVAGLGPGDDWPPDSGPEPSQR